MSAEERSEPALSALFSGRSWARNVELYITIRDMPFNRELAAGTLKQGVFQHYMIQDAHYLVVFAQALAAAAAKADTPSLILQLSEGAATAVAVERDLHDRYFQQFGLKAEQVAQTDMSPACHHYCAFLLATAFREPLPVLLAALLPCFWIYREVGRHIFGTAAPDNPYRAWIDTYASLEFAVAVDRMIEATDLVATPSSPSLLDAMHRAFTRAVQFEWMFWDSAYRLEQWPVSL